MSDVVAEVLDDDHGAQAQEATGRPGFVRVFFFVFVGTWLGAFFGTIALAAPSFLGVASADAVGEHTVPFALDSRGAALADVAVAVAMLWAVTLTVRYWLTTFVGGRPAWTWTGATLLLAGLAAIFTGLTAGGAVALAAAAVRWTVYRADGATYPEPFTFGLTRRRALVASVLLPVLAIGFATGYAVYHPLSDNTADSVGAPKRLAPGKTPLYVVGPPIYNGGGRAVEILGIEPGVEHGYALHLEDVGLLPEVGYIADRKPFTPFTLQPKDATYSSIVLRLSRHGCRPGATGRIDSLRVRYDLGGVRTALVRLKQPLTLSC